MSVARNRECERASWWHCVSSGFVSSISEVVSGSRGSSRKGKDGMAAWQHDSSRQQAFISRSRLKAIRTFSGISVGGGSSEKRSRSGGTHLALGLAHLVVQPTVVELVELQRVDVRQHAR